MDGPNTAWIRPTSIALLSLSLLSCSSGGGGDSGGAPVPIATPAQTIVSGTVQAPGGTIAFLRAPSLGDFFASEAYAALTGLANVPDGTIVQLARLNATASSFSVIAATTTSGGRYSFNLTGLGLQPANDLIVRVAGPGSKEMRAFVARTVVDISPISEAAYQLAIQSLAGSPISNLTLQEASDITGATSLIALLQNVGNATSVDQAVGLVKTAVGANAQVAGFIAASAGPGQATGGTGDIGNFLPLSQGNSWNYTGRKFEPGVPTQNYTNFVSVNGTRVIGGTTAIVLASSNQDGSGTLQDEYVSKEPQGLLQLGNNDPSDTLSPAVVPYVAFHFPLHPNNRFQQLSKNGLSIDVDGDGIKETVSVTSTVSVLGFETVVVPAGTFPNSAKVLTETIITASGAGGSVTVTQADTTWLAPGVGVVRRQSVGSSGGFAETTIEELLSFQVDGNVQGSLPGVILNRGNIPAERPSLASNGTDFILATYSQSDPSPGIIGLPILSTGQIGNVIPIAPGTDSNGPPAVAFDGTNYLVVYTQGSLASDTLVVAKRVSRSGVVLDGPDGIVVSSTTRSVRGFPAISYDGTNYLVAWGEAGSSGAEVYGARISSSGQNLGVFPITESAPGFQALPQIAFDGTNFLVVWADSRGGAATEDIYGTRVTPSGNVLDPTGIPIATSIHLERDPKVAFDGTNYFVVWHRIERQGGGFDNYSIRGTRVTKSGVLVDGPPTDGGVAINATTHEKRDVSVSFDGTNFLVAWTVGNNSFVPSGSIVGTKVNSNGQVTATQPNPGGFLFSDEPPPLTFYGLPTIFSSGNKTILAWSSGQGGISRIHGTLSLP